LQDVLQFGDYNAHPNSTFKRFGVNESNIGNFISANPNRSYTKTNIDLPDDKLQFMYRHADPGAAGEAPEIDVMDMPEFYNWFDKVHIVQ